MAKRDFENQEMARHAVKNRDFERFFKIFESYETRYLLVPRIFVRRLNKSKFFRQNFREVSSDGSLVLYKKVTNKRYGFFEKVSLFHLDCAKV